MNETSHPPLLDQLRQRAEAVRREREAARLPEAEAQRAMEAALWRAFRWLDEAVGHLEVIRPEVAHHFRLADYLTIDRPRFDGGFASFRRHGLGASDVGLEHVEMFYQLTVPEPIVVRVNSVAARAVEERLRAASLDFASEAEHDADNVIRQSVFRIEPQIRASVAFKPNLSRRVVDVTLRNVDRFESVLLEFEPAAIDEPALEDLARFVLGESKAFLHRAPLARVNPRRA